jgi:hypothetical protein
MREILPLSRVKKEIARAVTTPSLTVTSVAASGH